MTDLLKDKLTDRPGNFNNKMIDYNILYKIFITEAWFASSPHVEKNSLTDLPNIHLM